MRLRTALSGMIVMVVANCLREARPTSNGLSFPTKLIRTLSSNGNSLGQTSGSEGRQDSQVAIDPLSQVCGPGLLYPH